MPENKMHKFHPRQHTLWQDDLTAADLAHLHQGGSIRHSRDARGIERKTYISPEETRRTRGTVPAWASNAEQRRKAAERARRYQQELAAAMAAEEHYR